MFEELRETIAQRIAQLEAGKRFNLRGLLGEEWPDGQGAARQMPIGDFTAMRTMRRIRCASFPGFP